MIFGPHSLHVSLPKTKGFTKSHPTTWSFQNEAFTVTVLNTAQKGQLTTALSVPSVFHSLVSPVLLCCPVQLLTQRTSVLFRLEALIYMKDVGNWHFKATVWLQTEPLICSFYWEKVSAPTWRCRSALTRNWSLPTESQWKEKLTHCFPSLESGTPLHGDQIIALTGKYKWLHGYFNTETDCNGCITLWM